MTLKNKINYETQEDLLETWLETESDFKPTRRQAYRSYLEKLAQKYPQFNNSTTQLIMTYTNIVNFISKNAVVATIIMILAVGGASTAAAQFFAPEEYKPSNVLNITKPQEEVEPTVTNYQECVQAGGKLPDAPVSPAYCEYNGQIYTDGSPMQIPEDPTTPEDSYIGWQTFRSDKYGFEIKHPVNFKELPFDGSNSLVFLQKEGTGHPNSGDVGDSIFISAVSNVETDLKTAAQNEFEQEKTFCKQSAPEQCSGEMVYTTKSVVGGQLIVITNASPTPSGAYYNVVVGKPNNRNTIFVLKVVNSFSELDNILGSINFFAPAGQTQPTPEIKTYSNDTQKFQVSYPSDWKIETQQDDNFPQLVKNLKLTKNNLTLNYTFMNTYGTGFYNSLCTNNDNLFLEIRNGYFRIRKSDGSRSYVTGKTDYRYDSQSANFGNGISDADLAKANTSFNIEILFGNNGDKFFKFCSNPVVKSSKTDIIMQGDYPADNNKLYTINTSINVEGPNAQDKTLLTEADQIVASTKF